MQKVLSCQQRLRSGLIATACPCWAGMYGAISRYTKKHGKDYRAFLYVKFLLTLFIRQLTELCKHLWQLRGHLFIIKLACADLFMSAAVVFEHQAADIHVRRLI